MKKAEIEANIKSLKDELDEAVVICKSLGCFVNEHEAFRRRNEFTSEQASANIHMYCCISELNYNLRQLAKKNHVEFTNDMLCHKNFF